MDKERNCKGTSKSRIYCGSFVVIKKLERKLTQKEKDSIERVLGVTTNIIFCILRDTRFNQKKYEAFNQKK